MNYEGDTIALGDGELVATGYGKGIDVEDSKYTRTGTWLNGVPHGISAY